MRDAATGQLAMEPPGFSVDWYRDVTTFAADTPGWVQGFFDVGTDAGLLIFAVLFLGGWWRARRLSARAVTLAVLAPVATVGVYLLNDAVKDVVEEARPCRVVRHAAHIASCPPQHDWSFPSNHATIAAAAAAVIVVAWRKMAVLVLPVAALMAFSRVFVGVHYPHDVAVGFLEGVVVAPLVVLLLAWVCTPLAAWLRRTRLLGPVLLAPQPRHGRRAGADAGPAVAPSPADSPPAGSVPGSTVPGSTALGGQSAGAAPAPPYGGNPYAAGQPSGPSAGNPYASAPPPSPQPYPQPPPEAGSPRGGA